ncbi:MAG TPA: hypothetical protein VF382_02875, partial [Actinomycetota bacterium]
IDPRIVAAVQILVAMGIARFWTTWLRAEHEEPWLPTGYVEHERCFVYPDSVLAALMVVAAILLFLGNSLGERLTLVCGGMMLFLAVIDTAYFLQNGMFARQKGGAENLRLILILSVVSLLMILRFL